MVVDTCNSISDTNHIRIRKVGINHRVGIAAVVVIALRLLFKLGPWIVFQRIVLVPMVHGPGQASGSFRKACSKALPANPQWDR